MINQTLPIPQFFEESKVGTIYQVPYSQRTTEAREWVKQYKDCFKPVALDSPRVALMCIDLQNTFCIPSGELFVSGAVEDNIRISKYIYQNMMNISSIICTLDSHRAIAIFHEIFWVSDDGNHPTPGVTMISADDVKQGVWKVNPAVAGFFGGNYMTLQKYALEYVQALEKESRYMLTIWPYHGMIGGVGHALASAVEESVFFHSIARGTTPDFQIKGGNPLTESYSVLGPEFRNSLNKAQKNTDFIHSLLNNDIIIICGQAASHCVSWTIADLLSEIVNKDASLAKKVYILRDCTSPVVIPGVVDFTQQANEAFDKFHDAGMNITTSDIPVYQLR